MRQQLVRIAVIGLVAVTMAGCAASRAFMRGERATQAGDLDAAVEYYRQAIQDDPDRAEYKIAYERATFAASSAHADRGRKAEAEGRIEEALREFRRAAELDPTNRLAAAKASEIEQIIRDRIEASRPRPPIERLREEAQKVAPEPILSPSTPLGPVRFADTSVRDILTFMGKATGINVLFDRDYVDRQTTIDVDGVTLEQALQQVMLTNQLFYKVLNSRTIIVVQDTTAKRNQYEDQVVKTYFLSHADATEVNTLLTGIIRLPGMAIPPTAVPNKTSNTLTVRASAAVMTIIDRVIKTLDKPRAEVIIDVQILEVNRERAKQYGLNLTAYAAGLFFSPEAAPGSGATPGVGTTTNPFNLNTISQGVSTADFYLSLPSAILRFLESDSRTKVLAKPQLRGREGQKVELNLGEDVPIPSTTFTPLATGGAAANPLTSFAYRTIGIVVTMTPRVTYEGDVILELTLENSARGGDVIIAGQALPAFSSRRVATSLRLRDGEPNLLAGLLSENERKSLVGFPGIIRMPLLQQLFGSTDSTVRQTDIVMLLTPRVIRSHELTAADLAPIYIGPQSNLTLGGGPPPLIAVPEPPEPAAAAPPPATPAPGVPVIPPGSSPIPGMTVLPPVAPTPPPTTTAPPPAAVVQPQPQPATPLPPRDPVAPPTPAPPPNVEPPPQTGGGGAIAVTVTPTMTVGSGPYTVPITISGASRISTLSLSITYNPAVLRVRSVQEGTFMRQGGIGATFTSQPDPAGRVDIVISRPGDQTGAVGDGLLGALILDPVAPGVSPVTITGVGTVVGTGSAAALRFTPATVTVK